MIRAMPRRPSSARRRRPAQFGGAPLEILEVVRFHDLRPRGGQLVCITVYKCGGKEVIRRVVRQITWL
jgi:hypothetical protein